MAKIAGIKLKRKPKFLQKELRDRNSRLNKMYRSFIKAGEKGIKRRQKFIAPYDNPPVFTLVVNGTIATGQIRVAIEREDEIAESASLSAWELTNVAKIRKMYFTSDFVPKTTQEHLRTRKGKGHKTGLGPPKSVEPRWQVPRLNNLIVKDIVSRLKRGSINVDLSNNPFEDFAKEGDV
jgi:hypothetical protein